MEVLGEVVAYIENCGNQDKAMRADTGRTFLLIFEKCFKLNYNCSRLIDTYKILVKKIMDSWCFRTKKYHIYCKIDIFDIFMILGNMNM